MSRWLRLKVSLFSSMYRFRSRSKCSNTRYRLQKISIKLSWNRMCRVAGVLYLAQAAAVQRILVAPVAGHIHPTSGGTVSCHVLEQFLSCGAVCPGSALACWSTSGQRTPAISVHHILQSHNILVVQLLQQ
jgi:hypothetical protein